MLDGLFDALMPTRASTDKAMAAGDAEAVEVFAGLMDLVSLPELPLQAYLAEAAPAVEGEPAETLELPAQVLSEEGEDAPIPMWLLAQVGAARIPPEEAAAAAETPDTGELQAQAVAVAMVSPASNAKVAELDTVPEPSPAAAEKNAVIANVDSKREMPTVHLPAVQDVPAEAAEVAQLADEVIKHGATAVSADGERNLLAPTTSNPTTGVTPVAHANPLQAATPPATLAQTPTPHVPQVPVDDLAQHTMATIRHHGHEQAEVRISLHPAELGALDLQIEQDGKRLELNITVDNESARRAVGEQMMSLRERLGDAGLQLARLDVSVRDQSQRQNPDTPSGSMSGVPEGDVKNTTQVRIATPTNGLDLYA